MIGSRRPSLFLQLGRYPSPPRTSLGGEFSRFGPSLEERLEVAPPNAIPRLPLEVDPGQAPIAKPTPDRLLMYLESFSDLLNGHQLFVHAFPFPSRPPAARTLIIAQHGAARISMVHCIVLCHVVP